MIIPPRITYSRDGDIDSAKEQRPDALKFLDVVQRDMDYGGLDQSSRFVTDLVTGRVINCDVIRTSFGMFQSNINIYMPKKVVEPEVIKTYPSTGTKPYIMLVSGLYSPSGSSGPDSDEPWVPYADSRFRATGTTCRYLVWDVLEGKVAFGPGTEEELNEYGLHIEQIYKVDRFQVAERVMPANRTGNENLIHVSYPLFSAKQMTAYPIRTTDVHAYNCFFVKSDENKPGALSLQFPASGAERVAITGISGIGPYHDTSYDEVTYDFTRDLAKTWEAQLDYDCNNYWGGREFFSGTKEKMPVSYVNWVYSSETETEVNIKNNYSWRYFPNMYFTPSTHKSRSEGFETKVYYSYPDYHHYEMYRHSRKEPWHIRGGEWGPIEWYPESIADKRTTDWVAHTPLGEISNFNAVLYDYSVSKETPFLITTLGNTSHYTGNNRIDWISHSIIMKGEYSQDVIANIFVHEVIPTEREYVDGDYIDPGAGAPDPFTNSLIVHKDIETHVQAGVAYFADPKTGQGTAQDRGDLIVGRSSGFEGAVRSLVLEGQGSSARDIEMRIFYLPGGANAADCETCNDMGEDWPIDEIRAKQKAEAESLIS